MSLEGASQSPQDPPQTSNDLTCQSEPTQVPNIVSTGDHNVNHESDPAPLQTSSTERQASNMPSEAHFTLSHTQSERAPAPRHPRSHDGHLRMSSRRMTFSSGLSGAPLNPSIDWIVPVEEKSSTCLTVHDRLQPTIDNAKKERNKYAKKVLVTGWILNIMIALQILLGALTTAIAAAVTSAKQAQISTAILGALSTLVASYLARARGSGEPDLSILRLKDLEHFLRSAEALQLDHGHEYPNPENHLGEEVEQLRYRFEELLGNASGVRKSSPVGIIPTKTVPA